jgi:hypothetical protein
MAVTGDVTGAIEPIGKLVKQGTIKFGKSIGTHFISSLGGLTLAKLTLGTQDATETTTATIDYNQLTEVT